MVHHAVVLEIGIPNLRQALRDPALASLLMLTSVLLVMYSPAKGCEHVESSAPGPEPCPGVPYVTLVVALINR